MRARQFNEPSKIAQENFEPAASEKIPPVALDSLGECFA
jgi:hypothetical protein